MFEEDDIGRLFGSPKFMGAISGHYWRRPGLLVVRDHRYWMVLIAAFHGNRREEAALLRVKHVKRTASGIPYFNWSAPELFNDLKDVGSPRDVPLHRDFIRLGFMEARVDGRDPEAPLFPDSISHGAMGRDTEPFGKWFGNFSDACGVTDSRLVFHSWRHTVETLLLRAGVPQGAVAKLVGIAFGALSSVTRLSDHAARSMT